MQEHMAMQGTSNLVQGAPIDDTSTPMVMTVSSVHLLHSPTPTIHGLLDVAETTDPGSLMGQWSASTAMGQSHLSPLEELGVQKAGLDLLGQDQSWLEHTTIEDRAVGDIILLDKAQSSLSNLISPISLGPTWSDEVILTPVIFAPQSLIPKDVQGELKSQTIRIEEIQEV